YQQRQPRGCGDVAQRTASAVRGPTGNEGQSMIAREREIVAELIGDIGETLNTSTDCKSMRFCLIVWCDCSDRPMYIGGNEGDTMRLLKMMKLGADGVMSVEFQPQGTA